MSERADHFRFPLHITGDAGEVTAVSVPSVEVWIPQLERLLAHNEQLCAREALLKRASGTA